MTFVTYNFSTSVYDDVDTTDTDQATINRAEYYCEAILQPVIFAIGVTGNVMNLVIFTRQRRRHGKSDIERAAVTGLMFLAWSDMMYCLAGLMSHFLRPFDKSGGTTAHVFEFYYKIYKPAILNTFQFTSTWLTVTVSVERYFAVTYPFMARQIANPRRTALMGAAVYLASAVFNIPLFLERKGVAMSFSDGRSYYFPLDGPLPRNLAYTITWCILGIVVPLAMLAFCNVRFLLVIYRSQARFNASIIASDGKRRNPMLSSTTVTLVSIICLFFVLVCPGMVIQFIGRVVPGMTHAEYLRFQLALFISNTLLAVNFAFNFLLYCYAIRDFRKTLANMVRSRGTSSQRVHKLT